MSVFEGALSWVISIELWRFPHVATDVSVGLPKAIVGRGWYVEEHLERSEQATHNPENAN